MGVMGAMETTEMRATANHVHGLLRRGAVRGSQGDVMAPPSPSGGRTALA